MSPERKTRLVIWAIALAVIAIAVIRWAQVRLGDGAVGPYELFPLLGLVAFSLMWTHYVAGPLQRWLKAKKGSLKLYFAITSWIVLALILLHPAIFIITLWADGFGPPPASYLSLYPELLPRIALLLGTLSLLAFLAYEFHRFFRKAKWWRFVEYANIAAMFAIFFHALTLGGEVASGWFKAVWIFYGISLAIIVAYNYWYKRREQHHA